MHRNTCTHAHSVDSEGILVSQSYIKGQKGVMKSKVQGGKQREAENRQHERFLLCGELRGAMSLLSEMDRDVHESERYTEGFQKQITVEGGKKKNKEEDQGKMSEDRWRE